MTFLIKLLVIAFFIKYTGSNSTDVKVVTQIRKSDNCTTLDGIKGYCTQLHLCMPILNILPTDKKPLSQDVLEIIDLLSCGTNDNPRDIRVCCPGKRISRSPPDVANHPKLKLLPKTCGNVEHMDKVTGGAKAVLFEFTWMAHMAYNTERGVRFKCAGTIISDKYILTAAHCLANLKNRTLHSIIVGEYDTDTEQDCEDYQDGEVYCADPVQNLTVDKIIVHPKYNQATLFHDIGLVRVKEKMDFDRNNVHPICLPIYKDLRQQKLKKVIVTGWGRDEEKKKKSVLHKVGLDLVDFNRCRSIYQNFQMIISYQQLCAGDDGKDACDGDSGGPMQMLSNYDGQVRYVQYGIVSYGPADCGKKNRPGVYVNLTYYLKWILDNMEE